MKAGISFKKNHKILGANEDEAASAGSFLCSVSLGMEWNKTCFFFLPWSICALNHWHALGLGFLKEVEECGDPPAWTLLEKKAGDGWSIFSVLKSGNPVDRQRNFRAGSPGGGESPAGCQLRLRVLCPSPFPKFPLIWSMSQCSHLVLPSASLGEAQVRVSLAVVEVWIQDFDTIHSSSSCIKKSGSFYCSCRIGGQNLIMHLNEVPGNIFGS